MTKEKIIEMAKQAGFDPHDMSSDFTCNLDNIEAFAVLVASAEREACAKVCVGYSDGRHANMADLCAEAIRARGQA